MRTEIFIGGQQVFVSEETRPVITKRIIDIQNPQNRKGDRTLSFTMPGTPANDTIFGGMFEVNLNIQNDTTTQFNPDFNPNLKADFLLVVDTVEQLRGYCQLTEIQIQDDNTVNYIVVAYGQFSDLFAKVGSRLLTDIDLSEYDHPYTKTVIEDSWQTSIYRDGSPVAFELGNGYVYPMIDYGLHTNPLIWKVAHFRPAIYAKTYLDKIFEGAGFTYQSAFFDSERFKRLIIPFTAAQLKIDNAEVQDRLFDVERITSAQNIEPCDLDPVTREYDLSTAVKLAFNNEVLDPSNQWSTDTATIANSGDYIFQGQLKLAFRNNSGGTLNNFVDVKVVLGLVLERSGTRTVIGAHLSGDIDPGLIWTNGNTTSAIDFDFAFPPAQLNAGDEIFLTPLVIYATELSFFPLGQQHVAFWGGDGVEMVNGINSYFINQVGNTQIVEGDDMPANKCIPEDFMQKDFLASLFKCFNLYIEPHPTIANRLVIEPRDDYYTTEAVDWTYKQDMSREESIEPMGLLDAERYLFQYSEDADYLNKLHKDKFDFSYGRRRIDVVNDFVKNDKLIQPAFASTPLKAEQNYTDRIISSIVFVDQDGNPQPQAAKPRILYFGGLLPASPWIFQGSPSAEIMVSYPYAGHLDNPYTPTFDLLFGAPQEVYYGAAFASQGTLQYTDGNLYKNYWQKQTEEITDRNSRVFKGWFKLTPSDINGLSFRRQYFIKDSYFRLLEVSNYDPISEAPCQCTFIKIKDRLVPETITDDMNGGDGTIGGDILPPFDIPEQPDDNKFRPHQVNISGSGNKIGGQTLKASVTGSDNVVGGSLGNVGVFGGDGNIITVSDAVVVNSQEQTITDPGATVIANIRYPQRITVQVSSAEFETLGATPIALLSSPGSGRYLEVVAVHGRRLNSTGGYASQVVSVQYTGGVNAATFATELATNTGEAPYRATVNPDLADSEGLVLTTVSGGDPTGGDGDFVFHIDFIVQNL